MSKAAESYAACAAFASAAYQSLKMLETLADIPEHRGKCSGKTAIALKKRDRDIYIYYQDTRKNVWDALKTGFEQAYSLSVSIKTDCLCLQLTPRSQKPLPSNAIIVSLSKDDVKAKYSAYGVA